MSCLKIAICDDDPLCREQVVSIVNAYNEQRNHHLSISVFTRSIALLDEVQRFGSFDIYLLDIIMPGLTGIQLGIQLRQSDPDGKILFLTSSRDYAIESYRAKAFDYLLKPVKQDQLFRSLDEAISTIANRKEKSLIIKTRENNVRITLDNILYVELVYRRVAYHMLNGSVVESNSIRTTFAESIQELLSDGRFILCGSGLAVNLYHVTTTDNETLVFRNGQSIYIGKRASRDVRSIWSDFWLSGEGSI